VNVPIPCHQPRVTTTQQSSFPIQSVKPLTIELVALVKGFLAISKRANRRTVALLNEDVLHIASNHATLASMLLFVVLWILVAWIVNRKV
jgi:hypothetical protein